MPYIPEEHRANLQLGDTAITTGELNYLITKTIDQYINDRGLSYHTLNGVIGVLECAKLELYRRIAAPYEDIKIETNGDVYTCAT